MKYNRIVLILFTSLTLADMQADSLVETIQKTSAYEILKLDPSNTPLHSALDELCLRMEPASHTLQMELSKGQSALLESALLDIYSTLCEVIFPIICETWKQTIHRMHILQLLNHPLGSTENFNQATQEQYILYSVGSIMMFCDLYAMKFSLASGDDNTFQNMPGFDFPYRKRFYALYKESYLVQQHYNLTDTLEAQLKLFFPDIVKLRRHDSDRHTPYSLPNFTWTPQELFPKCAKFDTSEVMIMNPEGKRKLFNNNDNRLIKKTKN